MRRECRERFPRHRLQRKPLVRDPGVYHGMCVTHVPWCMQGSRNPRWRGKRSRHSRRMRNPQFYVFGKRPMAKWWSMACRLAANCLGHIVWSRFSCILDRWPFDEYFKSTFLEWKPSTSLPVLSLVIYDIWHPVMTSNFCGKCIFGWPQVTR